MNIQKELTDLKELFKCWNIKVDQLGVVTLTNLVEGHRIGTLIDREGTETDFFETITTFTDNQDGTYTYLNENGDNVILDIQGNSTKSVIANTISGHKIFDHNDGTGIITDVFETITVLTLSGTDLQYTDENGDINHIDLSVAGSTSVVTLSLPVLGLSARTIATHDNGLGVEKEIAESITTLVETSSGVFEYVSEDGTETVMDFNSLSNETVTTFSGLLNSGHFIGTYHNEEGTLFQLRETLTTITDNNNGSFTYQNENGDIITITTTGKIGEIETVTNGLERNIIGKFYPDTTDHTNFNNIEESVTKILQSTNLTARTEVSDVLANLPKLKKHYLFNYFDEENVSHLNYETATIVENNNDGTYSYFNEAGEEFIIDIAGSSGDETITTFTELITNQHLIGNYHNEAGTLFALQETISTMSYDNVNKTYTYVDETGVSTVIDISANETITNYVDNTTGVPHLIGVYTNEENNSQNVNETVTYLSKDDTDLIYQREDGVEDKVSLSDLSGDPSVVEVFSPLGSLNPRTIATHNDGTTGAVTKNIQETITTMVTSDNLVFVYTNENNEQVTIDLNLAPGDGATSQMTQVVLSGNAIAKHYPNGAPDNETIIYETITTLIDNQDGTFTYTSENGTTTTFSDGSDGNTSIITNTITGHLIATHDDGTGLTKDIKETITTIVDNGNNTFTYTNENGDPITISTSGSGNTSVVTNTINTGHLIATHDDGTGLTVDIKETVTTLSYNSTTGELTYINEDNTNPVITLNTGGTKSLVNLLATENDVENNTPMPSRGIAEHSPDGTDPNTDKKIIKETITRIVDDSNNHTFDYFAEDGSKTTVSYGGSGTTSAMVSAGSGTHTIAKHYPDDQNIPANEFLIKETVSTLVDNAANNQFVYTDETGFATTVNYGGGGVIAHISNLSGSNGASIFHWNNGDTEDFNVYESLTRIDQGENGNNNPYVPIDKRHKIGKYYNEGNGSTYQYIHETVTSIVDNGATFTYYDENGASTTIDKNSSGNTGTQSLVTIFPPATDGASGNPLATRKIAEHSPDDQNPNDNKKEIKESITRILSATPSSGGTGKYYINEAGEEFEIIGNTNNSSYNDLTSIPKHKIGEYISNTQVLYDIFEKVSTIEDNTRIAGGSGNSPGWFLYTQEDGTQIEINYQGSSTETVTNYTNELTSEQHEIGYYTNEDNTNQTLFESNTRFKPLFNNASYDGSGTTDWSWLNTSGSLYGINDYLGEVNNMDFITIGEYYNEEAINTGNFGNIEQSVVYQTVTKIENNKRADGSNVNGWFTYYNERGQKVEINYNDNSSPSIVTVSSPVGTLQPRVIATHNDGTNGAVTQNIEESITTITENGYYQNINTVAPPSGAVNANLDRVTYLQYDSEDGFTHNLDEIVTKLIDNGDNTFTYINEVGFAVTFDVSGGAGNTSNVVDLPPIGSNGQRVIATHNSGASGASDTEITESTTSMTYDPVTKILTYHGEAVTYPIDLSNLNAQSEILTYTNGNQNATRLIAKHRPNATGAYTEIEETVTEFRNIINYGSGNDKMHKIADYFAEYGTGNASIFEGVTILEDLNNDPGQTESTLYDDDRLMTRHLIGKYSNENVIDPSLSGFNAVNFYETLTELELNGNILSYYDETGHETAIDLSTIGGSGNTSIVSNTLASGNLIADHNDGTGNIEHIYETVTELQKTTNNHLIYTDENNNDTDIDINLNVTETLNTIYITGVEQNGFSSGDPAENLAVTGIRITGGQNLYIDGGLDAGATTLYSLSVDNMGQSSYNGNYIYRDNTNSIVEVVGVEVANNQSFGSFSDSYILYVSGDSGMKVGFDTDLEVSGTITSDGSITANNGVKNFRIEHPTDSTKWLYHACIESPQPYLLYRGRATTDANNIAVVQLPDYFDSINTNIEYQLTVIGVVDSAIILHEVSNNQFTIQTGLPNTVVSWQVTGIRNDAYIQANPYLDVRSKT